MFKFLLYHFCFSFAAQQAFFVINNKKVFWLKTSRKSNMIHQYVALCDALAEIEQYRQSKQWHKIFLVCEMFDVSIMKSFEIF